MLIITSLKTVGRYHEFAMVSDGEQKAGSPAFSGSHQVNLFRCMTSDVPFLTTARYFADLDK